MRLSSFGLSMAARRAKLKGYENRSTAFAKKLIGYETWLRNLRNSCRQFMKALRGASLVLFVLPQHFSGGGKLWFKSQTKTLKSQSSADARFNPASEL